MAEGIRIVHPVTGATLNAQATLSGAYMLIARQIFVYPIPRLGKQHTKFLKEPIVLDAQSYAVGLSLITGAVSGQIQQADLLGNESGGGYAKVT